MAQDPSPSTHTFLQRLHGGLGFVADVSLIPLFAVAVLDTQATVSAGEHQLFEFTNLGFCLLYLSEWGIGLVLAPNRFRYLVAPRHLADLLSAIPFGHIFQGFRVLRVFRALRVLRVLWRVQRYRGLSFRVARAFLVALATVLAGALAIEIVEPQTFPSFSDAFWWSLVTVSSVGYGDFIPVTGVGRAIASAMIVFGVATFGYVAGFLASILHDPVEEEVLAITRRTEDEVAALRTEIAALRAVLQAHPAAVPGEDAAAELPGSP